MFIAGLYLGDIPEISLIVPYTINHYLYHFGALNKGICLLLGSFGSLLVSFPLSDTDFEVVVFLVLLTGILDDLFDLLFVDRLLVFVLVLEILALVVWCCSTEDDILVW